MALLAGAVDERLENGGDPVACLIGTLLAPSALSLLTTTFTHPAERGKAFGVFSVIGVAGGAIGLLLGGVLTEYLSWRWCLYINVAIALPAAAGALVLLHNQDRSASPKLGGPAGRRRAPLLGAYRKPQRPVRDPP